MIFDAHDRRQIDPTENAGIPAVPQMLTNRADRFVAGARYLADLGYSEVNLNLGCPARTVVSRAGEQDFSPGGRNWSGFWTRFLTLLPFPSPLRLGWAWRTKGNLKPCLPSTAAIP